MSTRPLLNTSNGWNGVEIDASYITVEGFEIVGDAQSYSSIATPTAYQTNATGITIDNRVSGGAAIPIHVLITNNLVHDNPGSGIEADDTDYVTVSNNSVYNNANWSGYGQSGISLYLLTNSDTTTGTKNYVINNETYWNQQCVNTTAASPPVPTDGNGIIIDNNLNTNGTGVAYTGRTLVANNITFDNGGSGVHAFNSQHVDIVANTAYDNNNICHNSDDAIQTMYGQIFAYQSEDINIVNNILYSAGGPCCSSVGNMGMITEKYNILFPSTSVPKGYSAGAHDVFSDPQFANASSGNFMISTTSAARGMATSYLEPTTDAYGTARPQAHGFDIGALESLQ